MPFRVAARTILELGAELISSDGIALYELIKNGIDAGSRRVRIDVEVALTRTAYEALDEEMATHPGGLVAARETVLEAAPLDAAEAAALAGRLAEARDVAGLRQAFREWYVERNLIRVSDTGHGMSVEDLRQVYLTVGTRSRLREKERMAEKGGGPPPLGEKGVGRLSTMRLGDHLLVRTSKAGQERLNELVIDWTRFDHASDALLDEIELEAREAARKPDPATSGTEVVIGGLKADWSAAKLAAIAGDEFARLVDPWAPRTADRILRLSYNGERVEIPVIDPDFLKRAHGFCHADFDLVDGEPVLTGRVDYQLRKKEKGFRLGAAELVSTAGVRSPSLLRSLGPFSMEMWWFNRGLLNAKNGYPDSTELKREIARWAGGLMLFRDGYRVNPYGGAEDDWLELDKSAFGARGYKLNRQQVIGRVQVSWRNRGLLDQTNREGLVATPERGALIALLRHVLLTQFKQFIETEDKAARVEERSTLDTIAERVESAEADIRAKISEIERTLPSGQRAMARQASKLVDELVHYVDEAKDLGDQYADDRAQLVYLAGVGLMVEFVLHELDRATFGTLRTLKDLDPARLDKAAAAAVRILTDQLETLNKRVANLEALGTVRRQTKSDFDVVELVARTVSAREGEAGRHHVALAGNFRSTAARWRIKAVPGMFVQIVDNLLANALYWLKQQVLVESGFAPCLTVEVDPVAGLVTVTDNGPGIDPAMAEEIFQPFVTRKPAGEGRGLGLYISREVAHNQGWRIDLLREEAVRPGRYNTFVIDLSGSART
ncbi:histidine kinase [Methylorubrum populi]